MQVLAELGESMQVLAESGEIKVCAMLLVLYWTLWNFVGFEDGSSDSYTANIIADSIFS